MNSVTQRKRSLATKKEIRKSGAIRRDSRAKCEQILAAASRLLSQFSPDEVTVSQVAKEAGVNRSTIYNFFENATSIYQEISRRYVLYAFNELTRRIAERKPDDLSSLLELLVICSTDFYNSDAVARKTLFSGGMFSLLELDADFDILCARFYRRLYKDDWGIEALSDSDPFRILSVIQHSLLSRSVQKNGLITPVVCEQTILAAHGYFLHFLSTRGFASFHEKGRVVHGPFEEFS
jgi:AcrR family transcriptional regulator